MSSKKCVKGPETWFDASESKQVANAHPLVISTAIAVPVLGSLVGAFLESRRMTEATLFRIEAQRLEVFRAVAAIKAEMKLIIRREKEKTRRIKLLCELLERARHLESDERAGIVSALLELVRAES